MVRFDSFLFFFIFILIHFSESYEKDTRDSVKFLKKKSTLVEGEAWKYNNSFCRVSSTNAASDTMFQLLILVFSERLYLVVLYCIRDQPYSTSTTRQHRGRSTTPRNQQHENFVRNYALSLSGSGLKEWLGHQISISFVLWILV